MKGILLAGGLGTRLYPLTYAIDKVVIPVGPHPMFFYGLKTLYKSGIKDIVIVANPKTQNQLATLLEHFPYRMKIKVSFAIQNQPKGMVDAIITAQQFIGKSKVIVYPGDNISTTNYSKSIERFQSGAIAYLTKTKDPSKYGCPVYSENGSLMKIAEKPKKPQTNWIVSAPYLFDETVFEKAKLLKPSKRGELEITDLLNLYLKNGSLILKKNKGNWFDCGTFEDLYQANLFLYKRE